MALQGFEGPWWWSLTTVTCAPPRMTSIWSRRPGRALRWGSRRLPQVARRAGERRNAKPADGTVSITRQWRAKGSESASKPSSGKRPAAAPEAGKLETSMEKLQGQAGPRWGNWPSIFHLYEGAKTEALQAAQVPGPLREGLEHVELEWMSLSERSWGKPWSRPSLRDEALMASKRVSPDLPTFEFWTWSTGALPAQPGLAPAAYQSHGGQRSQPGAPLLHHLDLLGSPVDLTDLQPALGYQTEAVLLSPGAPCASNQGSHGWGPRVPDHAGPRTGAGAAAAGVLLQTRTLALFRGDGPQPISLSIVTGCPAGNLRGISCC